MKPVGHLVLRAYKKYSRARLLLDEAHRPTDYSVEWDLDNERGYIVPGTDYTLRDGYAGGFVKVLKSYGIERHEKIPVTLEGGRLCLRLDYAGWEAPTA